MPAYNFSIQKELFDIALQILEDYGIHTWSFGGGTALSVLFYQHRMSFDIDIFLEDFSEIQKLLFYQKEIARNLGIGEMAISASTTGITFYLEDGSFKLDFVYSPALTGDAFVPMNVFGHNSMRVQKPLEIIAKKLKFREKATIRDFVDYAIAQDRQQILTKLKHEAIVDIDRYFDVIEKFNRFDKKVFDTELQLLMPGQNRTKEDFEEAIKGLMVPGKEVTVAMDHTGEVVAFDEFVEGYRPVYEDLGAFEIVTIRNPGLDYRAILELKRAEILAMRIEG